MIRELTVTEVEHVSGAGFWGRIWHAVKDVAHAVSDVRAFRFRHAWSDLKHAWHDLF